MTQLTFWNAGSLGSRHEPTSEEELLERRERAAEEVRTSQATVDGWRVSNRVLQDKVDSVRWILLHNVSVRRMQTLKSEQSIDNARVSAISRLIKSDASTGGAWRSLQVAAPGGLRELQVGDRRYPLRLGLTDMAVRELAGVLGLSDNARRPQIERTLHFEFQRLYRLMPHERTEEDEARWSALLRYVDIDDYDRLNPILRHSLGRLIRCDMQHVIVQWCGDELDVHDFLDFPSEIAGAPRDSVIHAQYRTLPTGRTEWVSVRLEPPVSQDALNEAVPDSIDTAPDGDWPHMRQA